MGRASSNKKIRKAQQAGNTRGSSGRQRNLLFPFTLAAVVILGLLLVVFARSDRETEAEQPPTLSAHWHLAYGISVCGEFQTPIQDQRAPEGIHTHADGLIHIHPSSANATGDNANLGAFMRANGLEVEDDSISIPGGQSVSQGEDDCDGEDATVRVAYWDDASTAQDSEPEVFTEDFGDIRFRADGDALTIFYGPVGADIPPPPTIPALQEVSPALSSTTTVPPGGSSSTTTGEGSATSTTTGGEGGEEPEESTTSTTAAGG